MAHYRVKPLAFQRKEGVMYTHIRPVADDWAVTVTDEDPDLFFLDDLVGDDENEPTADTPHN